MPSGHGASSGGGHFGGGHSSSSFGGGHFGGSRSSSSFGGGHFGGSRASFSPRPHRPFYQPRVVVFGGRQVYLGTGRASAVSVLGILIAIAVIVTIFLGIGWANSNDNDYLEYEAEINAIKSDYSKYQAMAKYASENVGYTVHGDVLYKEEFENSGKYCIKYTFDTPAGKVDNGFSFYVYTREQAIELEEHGVVLALEKPLLSANKFTDSVPLDYYGTALEDDAEYLYYCDLYNESVAEQDDSKNFMRGAFLTSVGITVGLVLLYVLVNATAKKATAEQIAADKQGTTTSTDNKTIPTGTWRCEYCSTLNDNAKERCDGCGAKRQK